MSRSSSSSKNSPVITLADVPALAHELATQVRRANFQPQVIVYIETGARLIAWELCREFGIAAIAVRARRRGQGLKQRLAPIVARLPRGITSALRRLEERTGVHQRGGRAVEFPAAGNFAGKTILLVDDAADTGRTLTAVRDELIRRGAEPSRLRSAVLAATTPAARGLVDYHVTEKNSCFPWSADSPERALAQARFEQCRPPSA